VRKVDPEDTDTSAANKWTQRAMLRFFGIDMRIRMTNKRKGECVLYCHRCSLGSKKPGCEFFVKVVLLGDGCFVVLKLGDAHDTSHFLQLPPDSKGNLDGAMSELRLDSPSRPSGDGD